MSDDVLNQEVPELSDNSTIETTILSYRLCQEVTIHDDGELSEVGITFTDPKDGSIVIWPWHAVDEVRIRVQEVEDE